MKLDFTQKIGHPLCLFMDVPIRYQNLGKAAALSLITPLTPKGHLNLTDLLRLQEEPSMTLLLL